MINNMAKVEEGNNFNYLTRTMLLCCYNYVITMLLRCYNHVRVKVTIRVMIRVGVISILKLSHVIFHLQEQQIHIGLRGLGTNHRPLSRALWVDNHICFKREATGKSSFTSRPIYRKRGKFVAVFVLALLGLILSRLLHEQDIYRRLASRCFEAGG